VTANTDKEAVATKIGLGENHNCAAVGEEHKISASVC